MKLLLKSTFPLLLDIYRDFPEEVPKLLVKYNHIQSTPSVCTSPTLGTLEHLRRCIVADGANLH
jgi:hypothetical protein